MSKLPEDLEDVVKLSTVPNGEMKQQSSGIADISPDALRLNPSWQEEIVEAEPIISIEVRKPGAQEWIRVHPDPAWRLPTTILQLKEEQEIYLVSPHLRDELWEEILPIVLYTAVSRQGVVFLWPVRLPRDGRSDKFIEADLTAAKAAATQWVRRYWVRQTKSYRLFAAKNLTEKPQWPQNDFAELLKIAFRDRFIQDINDPVIKKLRGEI